MVCPALSQDGLFRSKNVIDSYRFDVAVCLSIIGSFNCSHVSFPIDFVLSFQRLAEVIRCSAKEVRFSSAWDGFVSFRDEIRVLNLTVL